MATTRTSKAKGKKVVNQEELRRLMRQKQGETTNRKKRIESPFAKYNSLGHLSCVLCSVPVKSEILWQTHVLGKQHKEKIAELKEGKQPPQASTESLLKRKTSDPEKPQLKKLKADADVDSCPLGIPADKVERNVGQKTSGSSKSGLGVLLENDDDDDDNDDDYNEHDKEDDDMDQGGGETDHVRKAVQKSAELPSVKATGLPADFFDSSFPSGSAVSHSGSVLKADEPEKPVSKKENTAEALPEGFFDDPVTDAKVRKVDAPKDQMDKEWDEFQKEIRQVNNASEAIVAEDDEEGRLERQIDEIDEQIECYRRVEFLREKQDLLEKKVGACDPSEGDSSEDDEDQLLQLLSRDWRAKGALS